MPNEPTADQLLSRKQVADFVKAASEKMRGLAGSVKSKWFSRPDEELQGWIERGRAISEIEGSMGYQLIMHTLETEIDHVRQALEIGTANDVETRGILKGIRFTQSFILTTRRNADISSSVLAGRESAIGRESTTFVKNARPDA
jgi:hypothetical protein